MTRTPPKVPASRERKPRGSGHERRAEILAAAKEMFLAEGYETVTTRKLAARAGLSQTGLYVYFQNKEDILQALCTETFEKLITRMRVVAEETEPSLARIRRLAEAYIDFGLENPDEYQLLFMASDGGMREKYAKDLTLPPEEQPIGLQTFLVVHDQIRQLGEAGFLRPMDPLIATQIFWMAGHGLVALLIARPEFPWAERRTLIDNMVELVIAGLRARPN